MTIESPTQTEVPSPTEAIEAQATPEAAEPEAEAAPEPSEPEPFARIKSGDTEYTFKDDYELVESELLRPHFERQRDRDKAQMQQEFDAELVQRTKSWETTKLYDTLAGSVGTILQKISDADLDGADKALARLEALVEPYKAEIQSELKKEGGKEAAGALLTVLTESISDRRSRDEFEDSIRKGLTWSQLFEKYGKVREEVVEKKAYERGLKDGRDQKEASVKAEERGRPGAGPDATPAKSGGGKRYADMTSEERSKLTPAERNAYIAQEMR